MVEDLANMAGIANASGGMFSMCPKAAHMDTKAYGLHAAKKPMQTATLNFEGEGESKKEEEHKITEVSYVYNSFIVYNNIFKW